MSLVVTALIIAAVGLEAPEPPSGFVALFNGKDLANWSDAGKAKGHWTVVSGVLHYDGKGESLVTAKPYGDFELMVDWKIPKDADSGIYLRGNPQVQIWDRPDVGSGGLFNNQKGPSKPTEVADKLVGEWNTLHITIRGDKVTVVLNGKTVVDNVTMENYTDRSKPLPATGTIELQHHGNPLQFRNIYFKEIP